MNVFELFKESFGVGVVASKKQAKDPRYSHSLTKDVRPDTPKKNQRALGLSEAVGDMSENDKYLLSLLAQIGAAEGQYTGKNSENPKSKAKGRYQFTKTTWEGIQTNIRNGNYKNYGIPQQLLNDILNTDWDNVANAKNPDFSKRIQDAAALIGAKENAKRLEDAGITVDRENLYKTWALGPGVAIKVINAKGTGKSMEDIYKEIYGANAKDENGNLRWKVKLDDVKEKNPTWFAKGDSSDDISGHLDNVIADKNQDNDAPEVVVSTTKLKSDEEDNTTTNKAEEERQALIKKITGQQNKITGVNTDPNARDMVDQLYKMYPNTREGRLQARKDLSTYRRTGTMPPAPVNVANNEKPAEEKPSVDAETKARNGAIEAMQKQMQTALTNKDPDLYLKSVKALQAIPGVTPAIVARVQSGEWTPDSETVSTAPTGKTSIDDLAKANNIADANKIQVGQKIKMPDGSEITAQPGDTLSGILKTYNRQKSLTTTADKVRDELNQDRLNKETEELKRLETELEYLGTEDAMGGEGLSKEEIEARRNELERKIENQKKAIHFIENPGEVVDNSPVNAGEGEYLANKEREFKERQDAAEQGRPIDPALVTVSIADLDLDMARAQRQLNTERENGNTEAVKQIEQEIQATEKVRNDMIDLGVTWMTNAGTPEEAQKTIDNIRDGNTEGINLGQKEEGEEREQWQNNQINADDQDRENEEGRFNVTDTVQDAKDDVVVNPTVNQTVDQTDDQTVDQTDDQTVDQTDNQNDNVEIDTRAKDDDPFFNYDDAETPEPEVKVDTTKKEVEPEEIKFDQYPNPGYSGEELRIYNQLSDSQKAKIISDFEKSKKNAANARKNITPRSGPTSIPDPKPRSLLDIVHQKQLSDIEGGTELISKDPEVRREITKALGISAAVHGGMDKRKAAIEKLRYKAPEEETPAVDTTPKQDDITNANVPSAEERPAQSSIGTAISSSSGSGMAAAKAQDDAAKAAADKARQEAEAKAAQDRARSSGNVQVGMAGAGTNLGKDNASKEAQDLQKQKAEADARKAEQEAAAAKQKAEEEAKKAEQERQRQAANNKRVGSTSSGLTNAYNVRKVPESAIFRAIMRK